MAIEVVGSLPARNGLVIDRSPPIIDYSVAIPLHVSRFVHAFKRAEAGDY